MFLFMSSNGLSSYRSKANVPYYLMISNKYTGTYPHARDTPSDKGDRLIYCPNWDTYKRQWELY